MHTVCAIASHGKTNMYVLALIVERVNGGEQKPFQFPHWDSLTNELKNVFFQCIAKTKFKCSISLKKTTLLHNAIKVRWRWAAGIVTGKRMWSITGSSLSKHSFFLKISTTTQVNTWNLTQHFTACRCLVEFGLFKSVGHVCCGI